MKEEYNLLQTYEIFLKIMYISLLKELYDQANRLTNSYMEGEFESKLPEQLTTSNFSYINRDLVGAKQELVKYEVLPEEIIFDTSARSYVYKFSGTKEIRAIELYPENKVHRVRERDVHIYVKQSSEDAWVEVRNWKFNKDEKNGALKFTLKEAVSAGYVKVRSVWDDRNKENVCIDDYSTFKGNPNNLLRIWTLEDSLNEAYSYDGNSNRISFVENGNLSSYEYYKNKQGGNTAKVKYDGKWYYTYDANGNRTSRAKSLISGEADKNKEYWTYEWDLWNRLVKVVQYNAPDNGECVEVSYEYDALNHRISRTSGTETTKYAYGRNGALAYQEKTKDGSVTKRSFTYLNNEIVGFTDKLGEEESVYYTVTDIQGSITEVYDGSSNLVWKSGYTAFGELAGETVDLIDFDGMYTGCDYDSETGLTYHWNRWRSEDGSCFISEDPARDGANWYGYCNNNPLTYTDPLGLYPYNNLNEAMEDYYTNYATDADRKQMHFFGLIDQASMGNKSAQNTLKFAFHQANQEMLQDISNVTGDASLAFLAIGCPEAAGALGTVSIVADILSAVDNYVNGEYGIANKQILLITGSMIASKSVENVARKIARVEIHIGKTSRYYEIGKRGAIKSEKALKKIIAKDIASGYFGENIAPEMASQIIKESVDAYKSITKQGENEKRNEKKNNNKDK